MSANSQIDPLERLVRIFAYGVMILLLLACALAIVEKFHGATLDDDARAACRRRGGDVVPLAIAPSAPGRPVDEWRCVVAASGKVP